MTIAFKPFAVLAVLALSTTAPHAAPVNVFATGIMPSSPLTAGTETWTLSGSFSDDLVDVLGANPGGTFEFEAADLASLDFSIGGTSIAFLSPTANLDSRVVLNGTFLSFSLFFDVADPFFGGGYSDASFSIGFGDGPYASDTEDLSTLTPFTGTQVASYFFSFKPVGGSYGNSTGSGSVALDLGPPSIVPLPAAGGFLLAGLGALACLRRRKLKQA